MCVGLVRARVSVRQVLWRMGTKMLYRKEVLLLMVHTRAHILRVRGYRPCYVCIRCVLVVSFAIKKLKQVLFGLSR